jgi:photosystem II stability/assembly factor-like uncharacterized protein
MKKIFIALTFFILVFSSNIWPQGWQWIDTGFPVHIFDFSFPPGQSDIGFAVGSSLPFNGEGIILKTTNGGFNWFKISADTIPGLKAVFFTSLNVGYTAGFQNFLMKTTDGGSTWTFQQIDDKLWYFNNINFLDPNHGFIVSYPSSVFSTSDAGTTWEPTFGLKHSVEDICYADADTLFLTGGDERIYKSTNGGFFWTSIFSGTPLYTFYGIDFYDLYFGMVCGEEGKILVTTNAGIDWTLVNTGGNGLMHDVFILNQSTAFAVGTPEQVYKTTDSGLSWLSDFSGANLIELYKIKFTANNTGLICGSQGKFLINTDYIIPVELTGFTAFAIGDAIELHWSTKTELNNYGFEIYRLTHGSDWEKIAFVSGNGTTTEPKDYSFTDNNRKNGNHFYQLKQIDFNGSSEYSEIINVAVSIPVEYRLEQNYPNPFNPETTIKFSLPEASKVTLNIYNTLGEKIAELVNTNLEAGNYSYQWDAGNSASGIYLYELFTDKFISLKKMILFK